MSNYELEAVLKQVNENFKNSWEQTRILSTNIINCFAEKPLKPVELMPFLWDNVEVKKVERPAISAERVKQMEDLVNNLV